MTSPHLVQNPMKEIRGLLGELVRALMSNFGFRKRSLHVPAVGSIPPPQPATGWRARRHGAMFARPGRGPEKQNPAGAWRCSCGHMNEALTSRCNSGNCDRYFCLHCGMIGHQINFCRQRQGTLGGGSQFPAANTPTPTASSPNAPGPSAGVPSAAAQWGGANDWWAAQSQSAQTQWPSAQSAQWDQAAQAHAAWAAAQWEHAAQQAAWDQHAAWNQQAQSWACPAAGAALTASSAQQPMQRQHRFRVAFMGDAFVDVQVAGLSKLPAWGTDVSCEKVRLLPGGSCANAARHLGRLGTERGIIASFHAGVGNDEFGRHFRSVLAAEGHLEATAHTLHELPCPQSTCVVLSGSHDRAMVSCYSSNGELRGSEPTLPAASPVVWVGSESTCPFTCCSSSSPVVDWPLFDGRFILCRTGRITLDPIAPTLRAAGLSHLHIGGYFSCSGLQTEALCTLCAELRKVHPPGHPVCCFVSCTQLRLMHASFPTAGRLSGIPRPATRCVRVLDW